MADSMNDRDALLHVLLERGVPYPLAREAIASTTLDHDERVQTFALNDAPPEPNS